MQSFINFIIPMLAGTVVFLLAVVVTAAFLPTRINLRNRRLLTNLPLIVGMIAGAATVWTVSVW